MTVDTIIDSILLREMPPGVTRWDDCPTLVHLADRGGATRGGITARSWADYKGWQRLASRAELDAIPETEARAFFRQRYVRPFESHWEPLRSLLVDFGVTSSHAAVYRAVQFGLKYQGLYHSAIDGIHGPKTRAALAAVTDRRGLYLEVLDQRRRYYQALAFDVPTRAYLRANKITQLHFAQGWNSRCWEFVTLVPDREHPVDRDISGTTMDGL